MSRLSLRFITLLFVLAVSCPAGPAALAAGIRIDAGGAAHLKSVMTQLLSDRQAIAAGQHATLRLDGPVQVEPKAGFYAVTFPHLSYLFADGSSLDIGIIAINATPSDRTGEWKMTVATPTPIIGYNAQKAETRRIDIGGQNFVGLFSEDAGTFLRGDGKYENITVNLPQTGTTAKIPEASVRFDFRPDAGGKTLSGPFKEDARDITIATSGQPGQITVAHAGINATVHEFSPGATRSAPSPASNAAPGATDPGQIAATLGSLLSGFESTATFDKIAIVTGTATTTISQASLVMDAKGFRTGSVASHLRGGYAGLITSPAPAAGSDLAPEQLTLDLDLSNIPLKDLLAMAAKHLAATGGTPDGSKAANMQIFAAIPQLLSQAGSVLTINPSHAENRAYSLALNGRFNATAKSAIGMDGKSHIEIGGLDKMTATAKQQLASPTMTDQNRAVLQKTLAALTVLQLIGQQGTGAQGQPVRLYDIVVDDQGHILINGQDISMLQALAAGGKPRSSK